LAKNKLPRFFLIISLIFAIILVIVYSKTLRLPLAIVAATTHYETEAHGHIWPGDLLVLSRLDNTSAEKFVCYDTLSTACTITAGNVDGYSILGVYEPIILLLILAVGFGIAAELARHRLAVGLLAILLLMNGILVGLLYIDQGEVSLALNPIQKVSSRMGDNPLTIEYQVSLGEGQTIEEVTCKAENRDLPVEVTRSGFRIEMPRQLAELALTEAAGPRLPRPVPVEASIPYRCTVKLSYGLLEIRDTFRIVAEPLKVNSSDSIVRIVNPNILEFNVNIIIHGVDGVNVSSIIVQPLSERTIYVPPGAERVYIRYTYFGSQVQLLAWGR